MSKKDYLIGYSDALRECNDNLVIALKMQDSLSCLDMMAAETHNQRDVDSEIKSIKLIEGVLHELGFDRQQRK